MENNLIPIYGHERRYIIGHWNESENKFIPESQEIMLIAENQCLSNNTIYPLGLRIMDSPVDGFYHTYRAIGAKKEDNRVIIYAFEEDGKVFVNRKY
jgi:hypothetical protein